MADVTSSGRSRPREEHLFNDKSQNQVGDKMNILESANRGSPHIPLSYFKGEGMNYVIGSHPTQQMCSTPLFLINPPQKKTNT